MKQKSFADMRCSIARSLEVIGPWWSFLIIRDAFMGVTRFKDFERSLGIAKNTLSNRLKLLVENGLLDKVTDPGGSKYAAYHLTEKGRDLFPVLVAITQWGDKWAVHEDGPSFEIIDKRTDQSIPPLALLGGDGKPLPEDEIGVKRASN
ncbi:MAG: helix-turn-helix transcriptional regulator [Kordiimonadaceae bacterium]|nr:helix-turn-helix transcriptional regulator [Kordiimonadaceae bacterium]MBO6567459.1 helix-turn-helix transcriptional regulator [Kordiimonadaceae bacterium]MBO6963327.1 helix-turn-helix transcriptional regulator [Kordiimonadaceae bacterium]